MRYIRLSAVLLLLACGDGGTTPTSPPTPPTPPAPVATSITLSATTLSFDSLSQVQQLTATVKDQNGATMSGASVSWSSSDGAVVTVSSTGQITSVLNGSATVTATSGSVNATAAVTVSATYLVVTVTGDGDPLPDVAVWLTDPNATDTKKVTDSSGTVLFQNLQAGEHAVTLQEVPSALTLTVTSPGTIQISLNQAHDLLFTGVFAPAEVTGTAKSWGTPVEGALVRIEGKDTVEVTVDSAGVFQVDSIRRGDYTLTISNHTGVKFKETTLSQTLESGANTAEFVGKPDPEPTWASVSSSCGVTTMGEAYCWGWNGYGGVGDGTTTTRLTPALVIGGHTWASVPDGHRHKCGVTTAGEGLCWGRGRSGELGGGVLNDAEYGTWISVSAGFGYHSCGLTTAGVAYCWGDNWDGELGNGTTSNSHSPVLVSGGYTWASVVPGGVVRNGETCGVTIADEIYCWGAGIAEPTLISGGHTWVSVGVGLGYRCGVTAFGEAYCWGWMTDAQLGDGTTPVLVSGGHTWTTLSSGPYHSCGVTTAGKAYCWGKNWYGGLGDGTTTNRSVPTLVSGGYTWASVSVGEVHSCGMTTGKEAYCWGRNESGGLGDGTTTDSSVPVKVGGNW